VFHDLPEAICENEHGVILPFQCCRWTKSDPGSTIFHRDRWYDMRDAAPLKRILNERDRGANALRSN
jgi:hypothetical protein